MYNLYIDQCFFFYRFSYFRFRFRAIILCSTIKKKIKILPSKVDRVYSYAHRWLYFCPLVVSVALLPRRLFSVPSELRALQYSRFARRNNVNNVMMLIDYISVVDGFSRCLSVHVNVMDLRWMK